MEVLMKKEMSEALMEFYQKILAPEFSTIRDKQAAHDDKFIDIIGHFDDLYKHLGKLEEEYQMIVSGMKRIEDGIENKPIHRSDLEEKVKELKQQFLQMQLRFDKLEREISRTS